MIELDIGRHVLRDDKCIDLADRLHEYSGRLGPGDEVVSGSQFGSLGVERQGLRPIVDSVLVLLSRSLRERGRGATGSERQEDRSDE